MSKIDLLILFLLSRFDSFDENINYSSVSSNFSFQRSMFDVQSVQISMFILLRDFIPTTTGTLVLSIQPPELMVGQPQELGRFFLVEF